MSKEQIPSHIVVFTSGEKHVPPAKLLCNWKHCTMGPGGKVAGAERLCPCCHRVGYCCIYCMEQDAYGHATHECMENIKKQKYRKVKK